ncbi:hypothetical protein [Gloeocapsopsis sp. IPPAS B-1203]|uniref:hypothetical protein n=1 Tax=Gloeocapsopsis sp. IPPAS B-1203 TaxID=2049454 RepID=UPI000C1811AF|nr:hypothetical protein [Gloeocapsopsis sp. IPPAS B-1203]PIG91564.1 hypothetical protein CSQ79_20185 [Gloeocapsopsis sp. IPPAS B-1203]
MSQQSQISLNLQLFDAATQPVSAELVLASSKGKTNETSSELPLPPIWLKRFAWWFRIGLGLFLLISSLLGLTGCSVGAGGVPWQQAAALVPEPVLEQVIAQNSTLSGKAVGQLVQSMQGWKVNGSEGKLVVLNFNTPDLCGALGCLYSGVWLRKNQPATQVFSVYLDPNLPNGQALFKASDLPQQNQALPCLEVVQLDKTQQQLVRQTHLCFNGQQYQTVDGVLLKNANSTSTKSPSPISSKSRYSRNSSTVR